MTRRDARRDDTERASPQSTLRSSFPDGPVHRFLPNDCEGPVTPLDRPHAVNLDCSCRRASPLAGNRPDAIWAAKGINTRPTKMLREARTFEDSVEFAVPEEGADVFDDYATMGLSLRQHPMALIRQQLVKWRIKTAEDLRARAKDKQKV